MKKIEDILVYENTSIKEAMRIICDKGLGIVIVVDEINRLKGIVTDGDIRRAIMEGIDVNSEVSLIMTKDYLSARDEMSFDEIINMIRNNPKHFPDHYVLKIPLLSDENKVVDIFIKSANHGFRLLKERNISLKPVEKVLIVGGVGYLGSVLCRKLLNKGYTVKVLDLLMFKDEAVLEIKNNPNFELIHGDMRDITTLTRALNGVDVVILLAAIVGDPASQNQPISTIETNYFATMTLAQACKYHQINRFIFASTCSVYGLGDDILDETAELNPVSLYARSKIESEKAILSIVDENFSPTILRMGTLYGLSPRMRFDLVVNTFAMKAATEKKITVFGGDQWRPLLNVEDAAEAFVKCIEAPIKEVKGQVFNVGSDDQNYQIKHLAEMIKEILPETVVEKLKQEIVKGKVDKRDYKVSFAKINQTLGFKAKKSVKDSILEIYQAIINKQIMDVNNPKHYNNW
ncbi:MAG: NAD-dependent epimerase/dehydratase family protein [Nanoarchaeota archaeon]|nr:NAD-dependent epimerase/dehydratase family protein [Nanoarchaeota archaeon]